MAGINALIAQGPNIELANPVRNKMIGQQAAMEQAMGDRKISAYDQQVAEAEADAPRRESQKKYSDFQDRENFMKSWIGRVYDDNSLQAMRQEAVNIWGQEADDNMPASYDDEMFNRLRNNMGVKDQREKYSTSNLVYDAEGNAYQPGSFGGLNPVQLPGGGQIGLAPKDRLDYISKKKQTEISAKQSGEDISKLEELDARLPALYEVTDKLGQLAQVATYTKAGRAYDAARKELGISPRDAAIARKEYTATVDNEILPLLKATFGAAFTVQEGESLRATLGDADATPEEKTAQLRAFIEAKEREVRQLGQRFNMKPSNIRSVHDEARAWAEANPSDPRAIEILRRLGR